MSDTMESREQRTLLSEREPSAETKVILMDFSSVRSSVVVWNAINNQK